jgi:hypothetical protein
VVAADGERNGAGGDDRSDLVLDDVACERRGERRAPNTSTLCTGWNPCTSALTRLTS